MTAPTPDLPPDTAQRLVSIVEFFAKLAGGLLIVWAFLTKVATPFLEWHRKRRVETIRAAIKEELESIKQWPAIEEAIGAKLDLALERQEQVFREMDLFVIVAADNRDRLDEMAELLNAAGYASRDRREHDEDRALAREALAELQGRLRSRRRREDQLKNLEVS